MTMRKGVGRWILLALMGLLSGCLDRDLKALNPCLVSGVVAEISVNNVDKVDLLFVVDNSGSMEEEQQALREQFPRLIRTLASGVRPDGTQFPPAKDMHLAVVTTDMGLPGVNSIENCADFGDDGLMQRTPPLEATGCPSPVPRFLQYVQDGALSPDEIAAQFGCIANVGTKGCGFEQQLEAALKALWPSVDIDPATGEPWVNPETMMRDNRITFIGNTLGHGGVGDANDGFLRNDPREGLSLVAVVVVTDEEDCSSLNTSHLIPSRDLPPSRRPPAVPGHQPALLLQAGQPLQRQTLHPGPATTATGQSEPGHLRDHRRRPRRPRQQGCPRERRSHGQDQPRPVLRRPAGRWAHARAGATGHATQPGLTGTQLQHPRGAG